MYNYNELQAVELSPTKKDYYQVWTELMDVAGKLSTRWDPSATNESDPGIVLLKVLTAITDKLSYNIDANTLEAFMPSAAQESSMRKLCEMLGYSMQYYKSASTTVRINYKGQTFPTTNGGIIVIDQFTNIKDKNSQTNYITLAPVHLSAGKLTATVECLEGELVTCQTENGQVVTLTHLDDNNRFYLPEQQVASNDNCVFISNVTSPMDFWPSTDNLNTVLLGERVYKFGFDSSRGLPYVQFPEDISTLIGEGLYISFVRTHGIGGNIARNHLQQMEKPASWEATTEEEAEDLTAEALTTEPAEDDMSWANPELYAVTNISRSLNGRNPETIDEAYWNYQKTIGTFDTLVTCRDYMNRIYQMTQSDIDSTPLVSNIIVSDIRDDINRAYTVCTYTTQGLEYKHVPVKVKDSGSNEETDRINYFDLVLYPFETIYGTNTQSEFISSFRYTNNVSVTEFEARLAENKTIAHNFIMPDMADDVVCVKVYFRLSARLATTSKVSELEAIEIEQAAHTALYKAFNMRNVTFGDELPYDSILKTLTFADPRIKNVILDDPKMYVVATLKDNSEVTIINDQAYDTEAEAKKAMALYKDLVLRNVLAGKVTLFNFNKKFTHEFEDSLYPEGLAGTDASCSKILRGETKLDDSVQVKEASGYVYTNPNVGTLELYLQQSREKSDYSFRKAFSLINYFTIDLYTKGAASPSFALTYTPVYSDPTSMSTPDMLKLEITDYTTSAIEVVDVATIPYFSATTSSLIAMDQVATTISSKGKNIALVPICQFPFNTLPIDDSKGLVFDKIKFLVSPKPQYDTAVSNQDILDSLAKLDFSISWLPAHEGGVDSTTGILNRITVGIDAINEDNGKVIDYIMATFTPAENKTEALVRLLWPGTTQTAAFTPVLDTEISNGTVQLLAAGQAYTPIGLVVGADLDRTDFRYIDYRLKFNTSSTALPILLRFNKDHDECICTDPVKDLEINNATRTQFIVTLESGIIQTVDLNDLLSITAEKTDNTNVLRVQPLVDYCSVLVDTGSTFIDAFEADDSFLDIIYTFEDNNVILTGLREVKSNEELVYSYEGEAYSYSVDSIYPGFMAREVRFKRDSAENTSFWKVCDRHGNQLTSAVTDSAFIDLAGGSMEFKFSAKQYQTVLYEGGSFAINSKTAVPEAVKYPTFLDLSKIGKDEPLNIFNSNTGCLQVDRLLTDKESIRITNLTSDLIVHPDLITENDPLVLATNEVIQFRAPNFKTSMTYPAYVNYFAKLNANAAEANARTGQSIQAVPATMWSLLDFFNGGTTAEFKKSPDSQCYFKYEVREQKNGTWSGTGTITHYGKQTASSWSRRFSWEEKVNSMPEVLMCNIWTTGETQADNYNEALEQSNYKNYSERFGGVFIREDNKFKLFEIPENLDEKEKYGIPKDLAFYVVHITPENFSIFVQWLKQQVGKENKKIVYREIAENKVTQLNGTNLIKGIYTQTRANLSRKSGALVDVAKFKYTLADSLSTTAATAHQVFTSYYVPQLWSTSTADHTTDGLGRDAKVNGIPANGEYLLRPGEFILLTYSSSEGREDGAAVVKNVALGPGTIVKSNFELLDSTEKALINRYSKTADYGPWELKDGASTKLILPSEIPGMHAFGANEQLEVREPIIVELDESITNLYWEIDPNNQDIVDHNGVAYEYFPFENHTTESSYILQAGEYLFYTGEARENIAYYGAGTEIRRSASTPPIRRRQQEYKISAEEASNAGLGAAIPWETFKLDGTNRKITIAEYQIINLVVGDQLTELTIAEDADTSVLSNKFTKVTSAKYVCAGLAGELQGFALGDEYFWEARGKFELSLNSKIPQTLTAHINSTGAEIARATLTVIGNVTTVNAGDLESTELYKKLYTITPQITEAGDTPREISVYASDAALAPDGTFTFTTESWPILKLCEQNDLQTSFVPAQSVEEEPIALAYESEGTFASYDLTLADNLESKSFPLHTLIEADHFGLIAFYLLVPSRNSTEAQPTVRLIPNFDSTDSTSEYRLSIFNNLKSTTPTEEALEALNDSEVIDDTDAIANGKNLINEFGWWQGIDDYKLKPGLNIVVIPTTCNIQVEASNTKAGDALFISKLNTVPYANQLNPQLSFASYDPSVSNTYDTRLHFKTKDEADFMVQTDEVYKWLREHTDDKYPFFYTNEPTNVSGLDLNSYDITDVLREPKNWFDTQNIANKFVVTQLDADHLSKYVHVSKFSKI